MTKYFLIFGAMILVAVALLGCGRTEWRLFVVYDDGRLYQFNMPSQQHCEAARELVASATTRAVCEGG